MNGALILIIADKIDQNFYKTLSIEEEKIEICSYNEGLDFIKNYNAEIVIIDCGLRINFGLRLLKKIKTTYTNIPVILIAYTPSEESVIKAFKAGVRDYYQKPVHLLDLKNTIKQLLKLKKTSKEKRHQYIPNKTDNYDELTGITRTRMPVNLLHAILYMGENLSEEICLADCAHKANLSKYHFCKIFKKYTDVTPIKYLTLLRINKAKELLKRNDLNITEIASAVGFADINNFIRRFKEITKITPKKYNMYLNETKYSTYID